MEENDWFTYTYDLGDDWQHRVTIEKFLDDYENDYPHVVKYKGDCPVEDCGGIRGYYQKLEIIGDPENSEYEEMLQWMESNGYPNEYDVEAVNDTLRRIYFYNWGKGEKRCQREIYSEHAAGKYGLHATKKDANRNVKVNQSGKHKFSETAKMLMNALNYKEQWESMMKNTTLADVFNDYAKEDLLDIAKEKRIKGVAACNKEALIRKLVEYMLKPEVMWTYFVCMQKDEIEEFEKAADAEGIYESKNVGKLMRLYEAGYLGMINSGQIMAPTDVVSAYRSFEREAFWAEQKKMSYFLCCFETLGTLYGIAPMSVLKKLLERNPSIHMEEDEIRENIFKIPAEYGKYVIVGDMVYHTELYPEDGGLQKIQGNKEFYIPTLTEIIDYGSVGYDTNSREGRQLKQFLVRRMGVEPEEAEYARRLVQMQITQGDNMENIFSVFEELEIEPPNKRCLDELIRHIGNLWNHTRMLLNRGFTPGELSSAASNYALRLPKRDNVIDFETVRKQKVYPNAPCPCGSGKKYKNCCRNKGN